MAKMHSRAQMVCNVHMENADACIMICQQAKDVWNFLLCRPGALEYPGLHAVHVAAFDDGNLVFGH